MTSCRRFQHASELPEDLFFMDISHLLIWPQLNPPSSFQSRNESVWPGSFQSQTHLTRHAHVINESTACLQLMSPGIHLKCTDPLMRVLSAFRTRALFFTTCYIIIDHTECRHASPSVAFRLYATNGKHPCRQGAIKSSLSLVWNQILVVCSQPITLLNELSYNGLPNYSVAVIIWDETNKNILYPIHNVLYVTW